MTIELRNGHLPGSPHRAIKQGPSEPLQTSLIYKGVNICIAVQRTPDYVFGQADLVDGEQYIGRLSIGNPKATPEHVQQRLSALAEARVDIIKAARGRGSSGYS
jgi:hypothetical protein